MSPTSSMPPAEAFAHLAGKVSDQSTAIQAMQIDSQHIRRALDKLVVVGEKQIELAAQMTTHGDAIDRAFRSVDGVKSELSAAIRELSDSLKGDRESAQTMQQAVSGFRGAIRAFAALGSAVVLLASYVFITTTSRLDAEVDAFKADFERRRLAVDIKIDAMSQSVQEVRLDRQRDREQESK